MHKRILIISAHFYPENLPRAFRTTELAKQLTKDGHYVKVVLPEINPSAKKLAGEYNIDLDSFGKIPRMISFGQQKVFSRYLSRVTQMILLHFFTYPNIYFRKNVFGYLQSNEEAFDLLISIAVPHQIHWGVAKAWNREIKCANTWIADCGDPFMGLSYERYKKPFYFKYLENSFLKAADFVSIPFGSMTKYFDQRFISKFVIIPQGFLFPDVDEEQNVQLLSTKSGVPHFIYAGTVMKGLRDPFEIIDYILENNVECRFHIYTNQIHLFEKYKELADKRLIIKSPIPRHELLDIMARMDFLINIQTVSNSTSEINAIPSKLIDYAISGRPILDVHHGEFNPKLLNEFLDGNYDDALRISDLDKFRIENVSAKFINLASNV